MIISFGWTEATVGSEPRFVNGYVPVCLSTYTLTLPLSWWPDSCWKLPLWVEQYNWAKARRGRWPASVEIRFGSLAQQQRGGNRLSARMPWTVSRMSLMSLRQFHVG